MARWIRVLTTITSLCFALTACHRQRPSPLLNQDLDPMTDSSDLMNQDRATLKAKSGDILPLKAIVSIEGSSQTIESDEMFSFPTAKFYSFKICLDPKKLAHPLQETTVAIEGIVSKDTVQIKSPQCVSWKEIIHYLYTAPSRHVILHRTLTMEHQGKTQSLPFELALNPWLHGETDKTSEVVDFINALPHKAVNFSSTENAFLGEDIRPTPGAPVIANDARVNFQFLGMTPQQGGRFTFDFRITPQYELTSASGSSVIYKLSNGEFEFEGYLLSTAQQGSKIIRQVVNSKPFTGKVRVKDGNLAFIQDIKLESIPSFGRLELGVVLKPLQKSPFLKPFKGIYILGDYYELKTNFFARLKPNFSNANPEFNFENYIGPSTTESGAVITPSGSNGMRPLKFEFEPLKFDTTGIKNETATRRSVLYQVRACIRNGIDATPVRSFRFKITKNSDNHKENLSPTKTQRSSEFDSCIYWDDHIEHALYPQRYFKTTYIIENEELNLREELVAYINPWNIPSSRDSRTAESQELDELAQAKDRKATIILPYYRARLLEVNYTVNKLLQLEIDKKVQLFLDSQVLNQSHLNRGMEAREPLREGPWKLRWAIAHKPTTKIEGTEWAVIDQGHEIVAVNQGRMIAKLHFHFKDLRQLDSRNYLFLEIAPVDSKKVRLNSKGVYEPIEPKQSLESLVDGDAGLAPRTFSGPLIVSSLEDNQGPMDPFFENTAQLWSDFQKSALQEILSENILQDIKKTYLKANLIRTWNLNEPEERKDLRRLLAPKKETLKEHESYQRPPLTNELIDQVLQKKVLTKNLADRLCFYFFDNNPVASIKSSGRFFSWPSNNHWLGECLRSAKKQSSSFFLAQIETDVEQITKVQFREGATSTILVGSGYNVSVSDSLSHSSALSGAVQAGLSYKAGFLKDMVSVGATAAYTVTRTKATSTSMANSSAVTAGVSLNVRDLTFDLEGAQKGLCVTVGLNPDLFQESRKNLFHDLEKSIPNKEKQVLFMNQKIRLCRGFEKTQSFKATTAFYIINQDQGPSSFVDISDIKNRPIILQLRGSSSFAGFLKLIGGNLQAAEKGDVINTEMMNYDGRYLKAIPMVLPTIPGLLSEPLTAE